MPAAFELTEKRKQELIRGLCRISQVRFLCETESYEEGNKDETYCHTKHAKGETWAHPKCPPEKVDVCFVCKNGFFTSFRFRRSGKGQRLCATYIVTKRGVVGSGGKKIRLHRDTRSLPTRPFPRPSFFSRQSRYPHPPPLRKRAYHFCSQRLAHEQDPLRGLR